MEASASADLYVEFGELLLAFDALETVLSSLSRLLDVAVAVAAASIVWSETDVGGLDDDDDDWRTFVLAFAAFEADGLAMS